METMLYRIMFPFFMSFSFERVLKILKDCGAVYGDRQWYIRTTDPQEIEDIILHEADEIIELKPFTE